MSKDRTNLSNAYLQSSSKAVIDSAKKAINPANEVLLKASSSIQKLNKWVLENPDYFCSEESKVKSYISTQLPQPKPINIMAETNKKLDQLSDTSQQTAELMSILVEAIDATKQLNEAMVSTLNEQASKLSDSNELMKAYHDEDSESSKDALIIAKDSAKSSKIAAGASIAAIVVTLVLWVIDHINFIAVIKSLL